MQGCIGYNCGRSCSCTEFQGGVHVGPHQPKLGDKLCEDTTTGKCFVDATSCPNDDRGHCIWRGVDTTGALGNTSHIVTAPALKLGCIGDGCTAQCGPEPPSCGKECAGVGCAGDCTGTECGQGCAGKNCAVQWLVLRVALRSWAHLFTCSLTVAYE